MSFRHYGYAVGDLQKYSDRVAHHTFALRDHRAYTEEERRVARYHLREILHTAEALVRDTTDALEALK